MANLRLSYMNRIAYSHVHMSGPTFDIPDPHTQPEFYADLAMKRLVAFGIDTVLVLVICALLVVLTAFAALWFLPLVVTNINLAYRTVTLAQGSATWGMRIMAIEFRTDQGEQFDLRLAFLHSLGLTVSFLMPFIQLVSVGLMATGARGQGLTDLVLGTVALNRRAAS